MTQATPPPDRHTIGTRNKKAYEDQKKVGGAELASARYYTNEPEQYRGRWKDFFGNEKPIELEIGCGKCTFSAEKAKRDPDKNFIALDIKSDMLGVGRRNVERTFAEAPVKPPTTTSHWYAVTSSRSTRRSPPTITLR